jgi:hypothetical protein
MQRRFFLVSLYLVPTDWPHFRSPRADTNYQFESSLLAHLRVTKISMQIYRGRCVCVSVFVSFRLYRNQRVERDRNWHQICAAKWGALFTD